MQRTLKATFLRDIYEKSQLSESIPLVLIQDEKLEGECLPAIEAADLVLPCTGNKLLHFETIQGL